MAGTERQRLTDWILLAGLGTLAWVGAVAYLGPFRPTPLSRFLAEILPLAHFYWGSVAICGLVLLGALLLRDRAGAYASATVLAYIAGFQLLNIFHAIHDPQFEVPFRSIEDAQGFALFRIYFGASLAAPMLVAWLLFGRGVQTLHLGFGSLMVQSRSMSVRERLSSWLSALFGGYLLFIVIMFVVFQVGVGFAPILSGTLLPLLTGVLLASLVNATIEEIVFRGLMQPAFIAAAGLTAGLWMQGLVFGLLHWGMTVGFLAALPMSLAIGFGSIIWGKAAWETRGLAWPIAAHAMIDIAIMAAFFVPGGAV
jgi:membrane protease YdiL (CAAX protease family)